MSLPLYDHHVHLDDPRLSDGDIQSGLDDPRLVGAVNAGYGPERDACARVWVAQDPRLHRSVGLHPWWLANHSESQIGEQWASVLAAAVEPGVVAIGEMGLDRNIRDKSPLDRQVAHLQLALVACQRHGLPAILHVVRWTGHALKILTELPPPSGVLHRYGGPVELVRTFQQLGLFISIDTTRWMRHPDQVAAIIAVADPNLVLVETDWPQRPRPWAEALDDLERLVRFIARGRGLSAELVADQLVANARRLYGTCAIQ
ncbi:MAG TPA: hypothetical protein DCQ06_11105 [Myxococcales bacterium]|nr:hypothetical protein [Myxococcales bacterium]HAN32136.1 hypothetical protein [Myxococcales bacterium]